MTYRDKLHLDLRLHFDERFARALSVFDGGAHGTRFALVQSASYFLNTNGFRWAMDLAFRETYRLAETPARAAERLADVELMVITHGHGDHFEERTVRALAETRMHWVIPDFLAAQAVEWGILPERMHIARDGESLCAGQLTILPFTGRHFRPGSGKGVPAYGYHISAEGAPALLFPGDVRDFSTDGLPDLPPSDWCFAHVWLGDKTALSADLAAPCDRLARFMLAFSPRGILLTHLYESTRADDAMWRDTHAALVADAIHALSPTTAVIVPWSGEILDLNRI